MRRKLALVLIGIMGLMVTLMAIPSSAERAKEPQGKAPKARIQGLKPEVRRAVRFGETTAKLRDLPAEPNLMADSSKLTRRRVVNRRNSTPLNRALQPRTTVDTDAAIRGAKGSSPSAVAGGSVTPPPIGSFEGLADTDNATVGLGLVNPPDTNADVGYTQIVETVNSTFRVYDKTGAPITPVLKQSTLFEPLGGQCAQTDPGDPIVLHDRIADRWQISQFNFAGAGDDPPFHQCIAISKTSDAAGEYYLYDFITPGPNDFPDYPKLGVWPDAYYMSTRQFDADSSAFLGLGCFAFDRAKMLAGDPTATLIFFAIPFDANYPSGTSSGIIPSDHDGILPPPPGAPNVFAIYDSDEFGADDEVHLFDFHADFTTPANSTFTERPESPIDVPAFNDEEPAGRADIEEPPPGENLDSIPDRLMFRLAYRNRGGVESLVTNHTVNVSGVTVTSAATYQAASRYYEFRKSSPGAPYTVYDAATYSPDAGNGATGINRWMGSTAIDDQGNLGMGYSLSSTAVVPSIAYVGRAFDQLGTSLTNEQILFPGQGTQAAGSGNRWGDYTSMSVDPVDDCTFWYANEYYPPGNTGFNWHTRIGNFKFPTCTAPAQGTLTGTITACDSGAPIGEVLIQATGGPSNGFSVATADDGTYTLHLAPGTYTVTASSGIRNCQASASAQVVITDGGTATFSTCLNGTANLVLPEDDLTPATVDANGGNDNGQIDGNECNTLHVDVMNAGCQPARNVVGTLSTTTPGVTITQPTSPYPNIPIDETRTNTIPFGVQTDASFACGTPIVFTLTLTYTGGSDVLTFTLQTCQQPPQAFSGTIQPGDSQTANGRLGRDGSPSSCAGKTCPGPLGAGGRSYDTHTFVNDGGVDACVSVDVASACGATIFAAAYLTSFNPADLCQNYLGDAGSSSTMMHFEVTVPAGATVVVVIMEANAGTTCAYTGTVSGLIGDIDGGGACADLSVTKEDTPDQVAVGENITYDIKVTNNGAGTATGVVLTDRLPSSSSFVSSTPGAPTCVHNGATFGGIVTCNLGDLASGAMATVQIVVKTRGNPNTIFNTATVSSTSGDGNATNDSASTDTQVIGVRSLKITPAMITGGCQGLTGTVTISNNAGPGGVVVNLHSNNPKAHVPPTVTVPEGSNTATFNILTDLTPTDQIVTITASLGTTKASAKFTLKMMVITSFSIAPNPVHGGNDATATVTLPCVVNQTVTVTLTSNRPEAQPAGSIVIPAGSSMGSQTIHTSAVNSIRNATITARLPNGKVKTTVLQITP
ncbi:MAG: hypothetical protein WCF57_02875 [Pyrinomonadaceae bacterium]